jgi:hypothetical protein
MTGPPTPEAIAGFDAAIIEILRRRHPDRTWRMLGRGEREAQHGQLAADDSTAGADDGITDHPTPRET